MSLHNNITIFYCLSSVADTGQDVVIKNTLFVGGLHLRSLDHNCDHVYCTHIDIGVNIYDT